MTLVSASSRSQLPGCGVMLAMISTAPFGPQIIWSFINEPVAVQLPSI